MCNRLKALDGKTVGYSVNDVVFVGFVLDSATNISLQGVYIPISHISRYLGVHFLDFVVQYTEYKIVIGGKIQASK